MYGDLGSVRNCDRRCHFETFLLHQGSRCTQSKNLSEVVSVCLHSLHILVVASLLGPESRV